MSDADRTLRLAECVRRLHVRVGNGVGLEDLAVRWIVLDEVRNGAGFAAWRSADLVAVGLWPSDGLKLIGYELKVSRGDLKRELANPAKAVETARFCDSWWLVVWDAAMLDGFTVPETWGIMARERDDHGDTLTIVRKAPPVPEPLPATISRHALAVLLRGAVRASAGAYQLAEGIRQAARRSYDDGKRTGHATALAEIGEILRPLEGRWQQRPERERWEPRPDAETLARYAITLLNEAGSGAPGGTPNDQGAPR